MKLLALEVSELTAEMEKLLAKKVMVNFKSKCWNKQTSESVLETAQVAAEKESSDSSKPTACVASFAAVDQHVVRESFNKLSHVSLGHSYQIFFKCVCWKMKD